jgi:hypothetical protein
MLTFSPLDLWETKWFGLACAAQQRLDPQGERANTSGGERGLPYPIT